MDAIFAAAYSEAKSTSHLVALQGRDQNYKHC